MITLDVAEYCHNCEAFEPVAEKKFLFVDNDVLIDNPEGSMVVRCENKRKCMAIARYIERTINERSDGKA